MASTYTDQLGLEKQADGENENTWGQIVNNQLELIEEAAVGLLDLVVASADVTLVMQNGSSHPTLSARPAMVHVTGTLSANVNVIIPARAKWYLVFNDTAGAFSLNFKTSTGTPVEVVQGTIQMVMCDGLDCVVLDGNTVATDSPLLGGVAAANYARKDQGTPSDQVFTKAQAVSRVNLSIVSGDVALDASESNAFRLVMTSNATLQNPTNPFDGQTIRIVVKQDGTGGRTLAYGSAFKFPGGSPPSLSTGANAIDYLAFEYNGADSMWIGNIAKAFA